MRRLDKTISEIPRTHRLSALWPTVRKWLELQKILSPQDAFVQSAERIFEILDAIDPDGTGYRYPPLEIPHADLINFALADFEAAIDQIETVFFGINNQLNEYEETQIAIFDGSVDRVADV
jgi:hypothetical protein